jgi:hypothetical protein
MSNKLYYKYNSDVMDVIPFLWDPDVKDAPVDSQLVSSQEDYDILVQQTMGGRNRSRTITIVNGLETAKAIAYKSEADENGVSIITMIGDDLYSVGTTEFSGNFDDGIPVIQILTDDEAACDLDPEIHEFVTVAVASENRQYEPEIYFSDDPAYEL